MFGVGLYVFSNLRNVAKVILGVIRQILPGSWLCLGGGPLVDRLGPRLAAVLRWFIGDPISLAHDNI